jgi:hypothetical protein
LKPVSLGIIAAEASPTRVAMMVDQRIIIIMKRKCYVALKEKGGNER